jgi:flagellar motor protein MotB
MPASEEYLIKILLEIQNDKALKALTDQLQRAGKEVPKAAAKMSKSMKGAAKETRAFGRTAANAGYQIQDFIIQVQGGVDPIRAMSQQLPQLFVGFGALGSAIGLVAAAIPSLITLMGVSTTTAEDAIEAWDKATEALERYAKTKKIVDALVAGLEVEKALDARTKAIENFRKELEALGNVKVDISKSILQGGRFDINASERLAKEREQLLSERFGSITELQKYNKIISEFTGENIDETATALGQLAAGMRGFADPSTVQTIEDMVIAMRELSVATEKEKQVTAKSARLIELNNRKQLLEEVKDAEYELLQQQIEAEQKRAEQAKREAERAAKERQRLYDSLKPIKAREAPEQYTKSFERYQAEELKKTEELYKTLYPAAVQYAEAQEMINQARERGIISEQRYQQELENATTAFEKATEGWTLSGEAINLFDENFNKMLDGVLMGTQDIAEGFKDMAKVIITQMAKLAAYDLIARYFGLDLGLPAGYAEGNAQGNIINRGNVVPFATGGIVNSPTLFPLKSGAGLMGEAGPEAILPLRRGSGGNLGVAAAPVNVTVNNMASGVRVNTRETDQGLTLDIVMEQVSAAIRRGGNSIANSIEDSYSLGRGRSVY